MKNIMVNRFSIILIAIISLVSCKSKVPEGIIDRETMVDLLYDYHLAQSMAKVKGDSVDYRTRYYTEAVFRKYGLDESSFNQTMEWYIRNSEELFKIYGKIDEKYAEATMSGKNLGNPYALMKAEGDTMNIWNGKNFYILFSSWRNRMSFEIPVDTFLHSGDKLMWEFDTQWLYREGQKNARMELALIYENDSVATSVQTIYNMGKHDLYITVGKKQVKTIQGYVYQTTPWTKQPSILTISDPVLVKFKKQKKAGKGDESDENSNGLSLRQNGEMKKMDSGVESNTLDDGRVLRMPRHNR